ncbi:MAG TPA: hypothetical protein VE978_08770 [Chitinophagales bacterium]|nr:hypothetical protein [Chitinophagales bacterium]
MDIAKRLDRHWCKVRTYFLDLLEIPGGTVMVQPLLKMTRTKTLLFILLLSSCRFFIPDFKATENDKMYRKIIEKDSIEIDWFTFSAAYAESPDFLIAKKEAQSDTICISTNIAHVNILDNKILIGFYGSPKLEDMKITLPDKIMDHEIQIDTTYKYKKFPNNKY